MSDMNFNFLAKYWPYFVDGAGLTLLISVFVIVIGVVLGVIFALMKRSRFTLVRSIATIYIEVLRGTPMLLQILVGYILIRVDLGSFQLGILNVDTARLIPGIIAIGINSSSYVAEIIRGGINSIGQGQTEAALSLGLRPLQAMRYVIFPQAIRNILPSIGNEFITIIKDSSLLSTIGIMELLNGSQTVILATYQPLAPLIVAAAFYLVMTLALGKLLTIYEKHVEKAYVRGE
jgi:His/Glu/Gln/Arg/opine family amino acid ABC transporter permease subunit